MDCCVLLTRLLLCLLMLRMNVYPHGEARHYSLNAWSTDKVVLEGSVETIETHMHLVEAPVLRVAALQGTPPLVRADEGPQ